MAGRRGGQKTGGRPLTAEFAELIGRRRERPSPLTYVDYIDLTLLPTLEPESAKEEEAEEEEQVEIEGASAGRRVSLAVVGGFLALLP
ncbi:hypothetical protein Dda_2580 [Drechslerella dactyloides]|uniref:Uncharacterized protein n=1 Tax=Drechslerella dactyloides TaxID=74499 RepID=A0AAD6J428_DREDA|nr:hypothetical protein Dda_2580 [Drechslerella dactyloides]